MEMMRIEFVSDTKFLYANGSNRLTRSAQQAYLG